MDEAGKKRLVGAAVVIALAVIFVPMLLEEGTDDGLGDPIHIPARPALDSDAQAALEDALEAAEEDLVLPLPAPEPPGIEPEIDVAASSATGPISDDPAAATGTGPNQTARPAAVPSAAAASGTGDRPATAGNAAPAAASGNQTAAGPRPVPPGAQSWVVQVASVRQPEAARRLQDELRGKGYPAFVEQAEVNGLTWYRVRVGPEVDRARANDVSARITRETAHKPLVQRYQ